MCERVLATFSFSFFFWIDRRTQKWKKMKIKAEINSAVNTIYPGINKAALRCVGYLKFKLQILFGFFFFFQVFHFITGRCRWTPSQLSPLLVDFMRSSWTLSLPLPYLSLSLFTPSLLYLFAYVMSLSWLRILYCMGCSGWLCLSYLPCVRK